MDLVMIGPIPPPHHGQSLSFEMLVNELKGSYRVHVIDISDIHIEGRRSTKESFKRLYDYFRLLPNYIKLIAFNQCRVYITIAQSSKGFYRDLLFIWTAYIFRRKTVAHLKGGNYRGFYEQQPHITKFLIRHTLRRLERILVLGNKLVPMYNFDQKLQHKVFVVENGLPFELDEPPISRARHNFTGFRLLFLSNLVESKGYFQLLDALHLLNQQGLNVTADFAGEFYTNTDDVAVISKQQAEETFHSRITEYGLEKRVRYHGVVSGNEKMTLLRSCNCLVLPTNYNNEGQPISIIEALAFSMPIISTDYRAIPDMVIPGKTGYFVEYGSAEAIADTVKLLMDEGTYEFMQNQCQILFKEKFSKEAHIRRIIPHLFPDD